VALEDLNLQTEGDNQSYRAVSDLKIWDHEWRGRVFSAVTGTKSKCLRLSPWEIYVNYRKLPVNSAWLLRSLVGIFMDMRAGRGGCFRRALQYR